MRNKCEIKLRNDYFQTYQELGIHWREGLRAYATQYPAGHHLWADTTHRDKTCPSESTVPGQSRWLILSIYVAQLSLAVERNKQRFLCISIRFVLRKFQAIFLKWILCWYIKREDVQIYQGWCFCHCIRHDDMINAVY